MPDIERIPEERLQAAATRLCRRFAATMITAMAETETSYELIEKRVGKRKGWARKLVDGLITGAAADGGATLNDISDFMFACGGLMLQFSIERTAPVESPPEEGPAE